MAGEGRIQARGEPIVTLRPGDTVLAPGGEWHWHDAAPDHLMIGIVLDGDGWQPDLIPRCACLCA
jgi:quercetin dioxygenase-like cupin family protein